MLELSGPRPSWQQRDVLRRDRSKQRLLVGEVVDLRHAVVLQVVADRQLGPDRDPERRELILRADPRQHQQHGRLERSCRQDHLALGAQCLEEPVACDLDADGAVAFERDPQRHRAGDDVEVRPARGGVQERVCRAAAQPAPLGELEAADTLLARAVEVRVALVAGRLRGLEHRVHERVHRPALGHAERAAGRVERVLAALVVLRALEVRQHIVVAPAVGAAGRPLVEVDAVAADVDHRVDRAAAADHAAARQVEAPVVEPRLLLAEQVPVQAGLERRRERGRDVELVGRVGPSGLEHGDAHVRVLAQACREHAAGRPGADDDVVVRVGHQPLACVMTTFMTSTGCSMAKAIASGACSSG